MLEDLNKPDRKITMVYNKNNDNCNSFLPKGEITLTLRAQTFKLSLLLCLN